MSTANRRKMGKAEWTLKTYKVSLFVGVMMLIVAAITSASISTNITAAHDYNQKIGGYITFASESNSLSQISANLNEAEVAINATFTGNHVTTYDSPFYWDYYYAHSVSADVAYIHSIQARIAVYNSTYTDQTHNSSSVVQMQDWSQKYVNAIHGMIVNTSSNSTRTTQFTLSSNLQGAYLLNVEGSFGYWMVLFIALLMTNVMIFLVSIMIKARHNDWDDTTYRDYIRSFAADEKGK